MRNLRIIRKFTSGSPLPLPTSSVFCVGEDGYLFDAIGLEVTEDDNNYEYFLSNLVRISEFAHIEELVKSNLLQDVCQMQFIHNTGCLYLATRRGGFLHFYLSVGEVEELFHSETGLATFSVSPDSRLVVIITKTGTLLLLSLPDLELVAEEVLVDLSSADHGDAYYSIQVCWRHDSQYFGLNVPNGQNGRKLKFYDHHGTLFSSTEESVELTSDIIAWQPSGGLIVTLERLPAGKNGYTVSFFELNGLKRSEFNPREGKIVDPADDPVLSISWNLTSEILVLRKLNSLELWYRSNYVWMLKSLVTRESEGKLDKIKFFAWDRLFAYKLHVVFESGHYSFYDFNLNYSTGFSGGSCLTVSVNGNTLYCTPFRDNCGPPPYGYMQISVEDTVKEVVISSFWDGFLCVLWNGKVVLVKNVDCELKHDRTFIGRTGETLLNSYNWIWPSRTRLCCISENKILVFQLPDIDLPPSNEALTLNQVNSVPMNCSSLQSIQRDGEESSNILVRKHGGSVLLMNLNSLDSQPHVLFKVPPDCFHNLRYLYTGNVSEGEDLGQKLVVIGHDEVTRKLEVFSSPKDRLKLSSDCISITTFDDYMLYTTVQGTLEIIHVDQLVHAVSSLAALPNGQKREIDIYSRKVEKGAVVVSCCWNKMLEPTLVLQILPRGNLETIYPRPLVISSLKLILRDEKKRCFKTLMTAMRRHRIDANILLDELKLVENEGTSGLTIKDAFFAMAKEVADPNMLVLFVTEINAKNLDLVYLMREVLEEYTSTEGGSNGAQPYLATMAKLGLYEDVLHSRFIVGEESREVVKGRLKFLSFYADNSEILYEAALGTYDLNLTSIVADCLNKDPKEFLPILNELRSLPEEKKCFAIDNRLKRWSKGVRSLILDTSMSPEEIVKYIERHRLFVESLNIVSGATNNCGRTENEIRSIRRLIESAYGQYLENLGKLREASIFYRRAGNFSKAIDCCVKNGAWELALTMSYEDKQDQDSFDKLCRTLLSVLEHREEFESGARLAEVYMKDYRLAVVLWTRAKQWTTAQALALTDPALVDLILQLIKPKLIEHEGSLKKLLEAREEEVRRYAERLEAIKELKAKKLLEGDGNGDNFSDTESISTTSSFRSTSASSGMTGKTFRSSKNRRKAERKIYSLREGSQYEDIAITAHLWETFTRLQTGVKKDIAYTVECLWQFGLDETAILLATKFDQLLLEFDAFVKEIWSSPIPENPILESKYRVAPIGWSTAWDKLCLSETTSSSAKPIC